MVNRQNSAFFVVFSAFLFDILNKIQYNYI